MGKVHVAGVVGVSTHNMVNVDQTTDWHALSYVLRGLQRPVVDALCRHHEGRLYTCCDRPPGAEYTYCFSPFVGIMRHDYCVHTSETCRHSLTPTTLLRRLRNLTTGVCEKVWKFWYISNIVILCIDSSSVCNIHYWIYLTFMAGM